MNHGSLFSGIGGFDLAAEWMGWNNVFHCEWNPFGQKVLKHYWPNAKSYSDITKTDFTVHRGNIDLISGGFPCQDASIANQWGEGQLGLQGRRTWLFYEIIRAVQEIKPTWIVTENVANILKTNGGKDFTAILTELSAMGYNAEWRVCRASEVGAPHHRARVYLVAYSDSIRLEKTETFFSYVSEAASPKPWMPYGTTISINRGGKWESEPPAICVDNGIPDKILRDSIMAFGNAVVPQIPFRIFKKIEEIEREHHPKQHQKSP